jgi:small-conductance mechanosensitive channel
MEVMESLITSVADFIPRLLTAIIIIVIGLLLAKLLEKLVRLSFDRLRLNDFLERVGVSQMLQKLGMRDTPGRILSRTIYFLLIILFTQSVTRAVGLQTIADAIGSFFAYLPNLVAAFLVLLLGMVVSQFLGRTVSRSAAEAGVEIAPLLGRIVSSLIIFIVALMSISQLKVDTQIIRAVVLVILGGVAIAFALSFGLGTRDVTRNMVAGFYARKLFRSGEEVEIGGERGILISISPVQTLIEKDEQTVSIPNRVFLDEVVRQ